MQFPLILKLFAFIMRHKCYGIKQNCFVIKLLQLFFICTGIILEKNRINVNSAIEVSASCSPIKPMFGKTLELSSDRPSVRRLIQNHLLSGMKVKLNTEWIQIFRKTHTLERPYKCNFVDGNNVKCAQSFFDTKTYKFHLREHTNDQPFTCEFCTKKFNHSGTYQAHMR